MGIAYGSVFSKESEGMVTTSGAFREGLQASRAMQRRGRRWTRRDRNGKGGLIVGTVIVGTVVLSFVVGDTVFLDGSLSFLALLDVSLGGFTVFVEVLTLEVADVFCGTGMKLGEEGSS